MKIRITRMLPALPLAGAEFGDLSEERIFTVFLLFRSAGRMVLGGLPVDSSERKRFEIFYVAFTGTKTDEEVAWFLNNPEYELIQKKWNILIDYYKKEFGIDLRKMGNTTF
ncbi:MAG: hypothetical protein V8R91_21520 [Butyricimonas faecihominis]